MGLRPGCALRTSLCAPCQPAHLLAALVLRPAAFLASHRVRIIASLPCYSEANVDNQRGAGVFERSIEGLKVGWGPPCRV